MHISKLYSTQVNIRIEFLLKFKPTKQRELKKKIVETLRSSPSHVLHSWQDRTL